MSEKEYDVLVVGGGVIGVWSAIAASRQGGSVALVDQLPPGHTAGSSHGDGRIYRVAYEQEHYVDMMLHSLPLWHELQAEAGEPLLAATGSLVIADAGAASTRHLASVYSRRGLRHEFFDAATVANSFAQIALSADAEALFQPDAGVLFASRCVAAGWRRAAAAGADCISPFRLASLVTDGGGGRLCAVADDGRTVRCRSVVLAPGSWLTALAASTLNLRIETRVSAETVSYFAPSGSVDHSYHAMPVLIDLRDNGLGGHGYYALPMIDIPGVKASAHYCGPTVHPDRRPAAAGGAVAVAEAEEAAAAAQVEAVVASTRRMVSTTLPHVFSTPFESQSCLYTSTPDHDFILGLAPNTAAHAASARRIVLAGGGSGHAFKMAPSLGECAAALALEMPTPLPVSRFAVERLLGRSYGDSHTGNR